MRRGAIWILAGGLILGGCSKPESEAQQAQDILEDEAQDTTADAVRDLNEESEPADDAADEAVAEQGEADAEAADGQ